jgi:hypothetical protein
MNKIAQSNSVGRKSTRATIVLMVFSAVALFLSGLSYLVISTPAHFAKAAAILDNPNGDVFWVESWRSNRYYSLVGIALSAILFNASYFHLWRAQRHNLHLESHNR